MYKPKKRFGQHFLNDEDIFGQIIASADLNKNDIVWEIGAGLGALTDHLLKHDIDLTIFEIDDDLIPVLQKKYAGKCKIVHTDILRIDWGKGNKIKIVTNLPYQISSPFLYKVTEHHQSFDSVVVMLQKEVAKRVCAKPSCKDYGVLSLKTQFYFETEYLFEVAPEKFTPPPDVHSAVIRLLPRKDIPRLENIVFFWQIVEAAFRMKRKTLKNNLKGMMNVTPTSISVKNNEMTSRSRLDGEKAIQLLETGLTIDLSRRGETLSETEFIALYEYLLQCITS